MTKDEEQQLKAYKRFYEGVQYAMDNALDTYVLCAEINNLTADCHDALSVRP